MTNGKRVDFNAQQKGFDFILSQQSQQVYLTVSISEKLDQCFLNHYRNGIHKESKLIFSGGRLDANRGNVIHQQTLYLLFSDATKRVKDYLVCLSNISSGPLSFEKNILPLEKSMNHLSITDHYIVPIYAEGRFSCMMPTP